MSELLLVIGGTRSGKSRYALERARHAGRDAVTYIATARPGDPELDVRIAGHRKYRPASWRTIDAAPELADTISSVPQRDVLLLDSITLWLSASLDEPAEDVATRLGRAIDAMRARRTLSIVVSDEVGLGIVPVTPAGREFRDRLGLAAQRLAREADEVVMLIAGLPLILKPR